MLRPKKPTGSNAHVAFEVKLTDEVAEGEGGPYRAFFEDISKEL